MTLNFNFNHVILDKQSDGGGVGRIFVVTSELR